MNYNLYKALTLSCKVDIEDDDPKKNELFWEECTWTRMSDNADCHLVAIDDDKLNEPRCDKAIGDAKVERSADKLGCCITFHPSKKNLREQWKCTLQKCIDEKDEGCTSETASICIDSIVVNATVCSTSINQYSYQTLFSYCARWNLNEKSIMIIFRLCHTLRGCQNWKREWVIKFLLPSEKCLSKSPFL